MCFRNLDMDIPSQHQMLTCDAFAFFLFSRAMPGGGETAAGL